MLATSFHVARGTWRHICGQPTVMYVCSKQVITAALPAHLAHAQHIRVGVQEAAAAVGQPTDAAVAVQELLHQPGWYEVEAGGQQGLAHRLLHVGGPVEQRLKHLRQTEMHHVTDMRWDMMGSLPGGTVQVMLLFDCRIHSRAVS
eukprot:GHRQ01030703.1.p1 GENE.GHRQ01030703.1~~GHRQ01030703.1.p1  ORF type:complete len:145 (+),score=26.03 GHRQ01030703.1:178-612(+)